jgi:hypothetical protein
VSHCQAIGILVVPAKAGTQKTHRILACASLRRNYAVAVVGVTPSKVGKIWDASCFDSSSPVWLVRSLAHLVASYSFASYICNSSSGGSGSKILLAHISQMAEKAVV